MIHYFDFEQGSAQSRKSLCPGALGMHFNLNCKCDPGMPTILPVAWETITDPGKFKMAVFGMIPGGEALKIFVRSDEVAGIKYGTTVLVVFDMRMRTELKSQGWADPGPGMKGVLEGLFPLKFDAQGDDGNPF